MSTEAEEKEVQPFIKKKLDDELKKGQGVNVYWLASIFNMSLTTVRHRLATCPTLKAVGKGSTYELAVAARYLVDPIDDMETYIRRLKPSQLPEALRKDIWDARLKQQAWEEKAGLLWRTADVMEALSAVFTTIKSTTQLWADNLERQEGLTAEQRKLLVVLIDTLQDQIYVEIVEHSDKKATPSSRGIIEDHRLAMTGGNPIDFDPEDLI